MGDPLILKISLKIQEELHKELYYFYVRMYKITPIEHRT